MRYIVTIIGVAIGALIVVKSEKLYNIFGAIPWAEQHLGAEGGSRLFYKLIGLAIIFIFLFYVSGFLQDIVIFIFRPLFGGR
ncbi:MAG: hypothetical protein UX17_C0031G0009 [Parcubacteria group bacterium GW2011_GWC2_45_7]|nr:MAG: hypothetical protein UX17_C0031G0009 [Parcubacteria group bacterium GW2011_GWC2_45_7]KKU72916.1 MAG: hypothetical protein UX98_C0014G0009 [Parcubacteria group bacterium GW2011_GWA2_47_26]HBO99878.1 hypothetical protein [Candidatus Uhrbacteria bacterium]